MALGSLPWFQHMLVERHWRLVSRQVPCVLDSTSGTDYIFYQVLTLLPLRVLILEFGSVLFSSLFSSTRKDWFDRTNLSIVKSFPLHSLLQCQGSAAVNARAGWGHAASPCHWGVSLSSAAGAVGRPSPSSVHSPQQSRASEYLLNSATGVPGLWDLRSWVNSDWIITLVTYVVIWRIP